jgi:MFS superfamily sulfate permease-like transporter
MVAGTMAIVASLESLLSLEASDKLDPYKRTSPPNRELKAQGVGNIISGLLGGLPVTAVIVRSSANVTAGARTRISAISHGLFMAGFVLLTPQLLNHIPLAGLASILLYIGYKLSTVGLYKGMYRLGWPQFLPFLTTVLAIVFTDLLTGIAIGLIVAVFFILRNNYNNAFVLTKEQASDGNKGLFKLSLSQEVSYLNKGAIAKFLQEVPLRSHVIIDGTAATYIDHDVLEVIQDFKINAPSRDIELTLVNIPAVELIQNH